MLVDTVRLDQTGKHHKHMPDSDSGWSLSPCQAPEPHIRVTSSCRPTVIEPHWLGTQLRQTFLSSLQSPRKDGQLLPNACHSRTVARLLGLFQSLWQTLISPGDHDDGILV